MDVTIPTNLVCVLFDPAIPTSSFNFIVFLYLLHEGIRAWNNNRTFSMHIAQMSEHSIVCADIMSRLSLRSKSWALWLSIATTNCFWWVTIYISTTTCQTKVTFGIMEWNLSSQLQTVLLHVVQFAVQSVDCCPTCNDRSYRIQKMSERNLKMSVQNW